MEAYVVPVPLAASAVKAAHKAWQESGGTSNDTNTAPAIWLDKALPTSDRFVEKWTKFQLGSTPVV